MFLLHLILSSASACTPDALVDDFNKITRGYLPNDPDYKYFNLLGGDYGQLGANFTIDTGSKSMTISAGSVDVGSPDPKSNPGTNPTVNYWFAKFDVNACFNLVDYTGIQFDLVAPVGSDMNFTLTQHAPDCQTRLLDSVYHPLSNYSLPNGSKQTVFIPFADFATNLKGGSFDMFHLKDWTAVNLVPVDAVFVMSNIVLKGNCSPSSSSSSSRPVPTSTSTITSGVERVSVNGFLSLMVLTSLFFL